VGYGGSRGPDRVSAICLSNFALVAAPDGRPSACRHWPYDAGFISRSELEAHLGVFDEKLADPEVLD
jgi:hypothetical protein